MSVGEKLSLLNPLSGTDTREHLDRLVSEGKAVRDSLGRVVSDFDRRVREDVAPVLRRQPPLRIIGVAGLTFFAVGGIVGLVLRRSRRPVGRLEKVRRLRRALERMMEDPDQAVRPAPGLGREVLGAVGTVMAATVAKRAIDRALWPRA